MFKQITFIILFLFFRTILFAQLMWSNPQPSGYRNNKIVFTDANNGFIFNDGGDLIVTKNQGADWQIAHNFYNAKCFDIHDSTGVVAGYGLLYISNDNGNTWQKKETGIIDNFSLVDIVSRDTIFIASTNKIYKSFNRGQTWQTLDPGNITIQSFDFINSKLGFVGKSNISILKTTDGGITWLPTASGHSGFLSIKFINDSTGFAYTGYDSILKTKDQGVTWTGYEIGNNIYSISFPNDSIGYLGGEVGVVYRTSDGGVTWKPASPNGANFIFTLSLYSLYFITGNTGFAVGDRGSILKTNDGGATWQAYSPAYTDVMALSSPDKNTAYAVTSHYSYKTTNGGQSWTPLSLTVGTEYASNSRFENAHFFSADTGFVTTGSRIYKTYDGGQTWQANELSVPYAYDNNTGISFVNDSTGFMTFNGGPYSAYALYKTSDRAETWKKIDSSQSTNEFFSRINFLNEKPGLPLDIANYIKQMTVLKPGSCCFSIIMIIKFRRCGSLMLKQVFWEIAMDCKVQMIVDIPGHL